jgi:hypothetical protein
MDPMKETRTRYATSRWTIGRAPALGRVALFAGLAAIAAWTAACGSDKTTGPGGPNGSPVGNYTISTVNGKSLPAPLYSDGNFSYDVTNGTIGLTGDSKYTLATTYKQTIPGNVEIFVDSTFGTWSMTGTTISLTDGQDGSTGQITWSSTQSQLMFAIVDGKVTNTFVYTKK